MRGAESSHRCRGCWKTRLLEEDPALGTRGPRPRTGCIDSAVLWLPLHWLGFTRNSGRRRDRPRRPSTSTQINTPTCGCPLRWSEFTGNSGRHRDRPRSQGHQPGRLAVAPFTGLGPHGTQDGARTDPGGQVRRVPNVSSVRCAEEQGAPEHAGKASPSARTDLRRPTQPTAGHNCFSTT